MTETCGQNLHKQGLTFQMLLDSNNMMFAEPQGFKEIKPVENAQMNYDKAYLHYKEKLEIRYAIRNHNMNDPQRIFEALVKKISGGVLPEYEPFTKEQAIQEFHADEGASVLFKVGSDFGMGYRYCLMVYIHKKGTGDAYIFYLGNSESKIAELADANFHALKFRWR